MVFTRKTLVETHIRKSTTVCKAIVGIGASQLYPNSMYQPTATGLCTRNAFDADLQRIKSHRNNSRSFENMVISYFQRKRAYCRIQKFFTTRTWKEIECFNADGFCGHCNTVFEAMGCSYHYCPCQKAPPALIEEDIQHGKESEKWMKCGNSVLKKKVELLSKRGNLIGGNSTKLMCQ